MIRIKQISKSIQTNKKSAKKTNISIFAVIYEFSPQRSAQNFNYKKKALTFEK